MKHFQKIQVRGFRRFNDVETGLHDVTVLIGPNGAGKTTFLEVFSILANSAQGRLQEKLSSLGGFNSVLRRGYKKPLEINLDAKLEHSDLPVRYELCLGSQGLGYEISKEHLHQKQRNDKDKPFYFISSERRRIKYSDPSKNGLLAPTWEHNHLETSLAQVPKMHHDPEMLRSTIANTKFYRPIDVSPDSKVRQPQSLQPQSSPGDQGQGLVSFLYGLREKASSAYETIEDSIRTVFPDFEQMLFPAVAAGTLSLTWKDRNFENPFYTNELSAGTLRFLWLVSILADPKPPPLLLIDEPEVSLHPVMLQLLVELLREASKRTQIIVATQSDRLVSFLKPEEVLVCDVEDGASTLRWGDSFDLKKWLKEYTLGELWNMNVIGGTTVKIALIVEGKTETAFLPALRNFLKRHLEGTMPRIDAKPQQGLIPTGGKLKRLAQNLISDGYDAVIVLTDVYTGDRRFTDADDAKTKLAADLAGLSNVHVHAAQHDFEAWLIPYWPTIQKLTGTNRQPPKLNPEKINHDKPPAQHLQEIFNSGKSGRSYVKPRDGRRILENNDLQTSADACPELKSLINTILKLCGNPAI